MNRNPQAILFPLRLLFLCPSELLCLFFYLTSCYLISHTTHKATHMEGKVFPGGPGFLCFLHPLCKQQVREWICTFFLPKVLQKALRQIVGGPPNQEDQNSLAFLFSLRAPIHLCNSSQCLYSYIVGNTDCLDHAARTPAPPGHRQLSCPPLVHRLEKGTRGSSGRRFTSCRVEARALLVTGTGPAEENTSRGAAAFLLVAIPWGQCKNHTQQSPGNSAAQAPRFL